MRNLVNEFLLRLVKPAIGLILGALIYLIATGPLDAQGSVELALLCWLSAAAFIVLVENGLV